MPANVKQATRRKLHFATLDDILADAEAVTAGSHHTTGNHSAAELLWHIAYFIDKSVTGFGFTAPLPMRLFGKVIKAFGFADKPIKPGLNPPAHIEQRFWPQQAVTHDEALAYLRQSVAAARTPGSMTRPSPLLGKLTHNQWLTLHCRHAELHLAFIHPSPGS